VSGSNITTKKIDLVRNYPKILIYLIFGYFTKTFEAETLERNKTWKCCQMKTQLQRFERN